VSETPFDAGAARGRATRGEATAADHHALAALAYRNGDLATALEESERSRTLGATGGASHYLRGVVLRELGRLDEAAEVLALAADAAERDGLRAKALSALGAVLCQKGDPRAALEPLSRACWLEPTLREARHNLGVAAVRAREWPVAAGAFARLAQEGSATRAPSHYLRLLVDVGRASALDEAQAQGHRLKNLVGVLGDRTRQLEEDARAVSPDFATRLLGLVRSVDELYAGMKSYLDVLREEPLELDLLEVNGLVGRCLFALSPSLCGLSVERRLAPSLPEVVGDRVALEDVLTNVLRNAVEALAERGRRDASEPRDPDLLVATEARKDGKIAIEVSDRGPGLDPADRDRIFLLGYTTKPRGSGIGLAQARKLVRAHGGEIEVEGRPGEGALFRILLPTSPPPDPALPRLDVRTPLFESMGDLELGAPE
jgi:signal transduction histidine kinase